MRASRAFLETALKNNVVELRFQRRNRKPGWKGFRRMLCTNSRDILSSAPGRIALHHDPPVGRPPFSAAQYNLVTAWDLFWQEYRNINCDACDVVSLIPVNTDEEIQKFWQYFNLYLESMSPGQKINFMNT